VSFGHPSRGGAEGASYKGIAQRVPRTPVGVFYRERWAHGGI
jgi:hypothetical protein